MEFIHLQRTKYNLLEQINFLPSMTMYIRHLKSKETKVK